MALTSLTLAEAADLIAARKLSPVELTEAHLSRIEALDPKLTAFITVTPELALRQAREAERAIGRGEYRGPLHGAPLALKDLFDTQGVRTTAGGKFFAERLPEADSIVWQRLSAAGAILLGKLNMHEWALGVTTINPHYGTCKNPWALDRITGGSSGGSGAALAAQLCLGSMGSDTGGSIRIPSSLCGTVGLKPTYGRVSVRGVIPLSWNLDHTGPMGRRVRDVALLLQAVAGYDPDDAFSVNAPTDDYGAALEGGVRGWRVALATGSHFADADAEVLSAVREAARAFEQLGATVVETEFPGGQEAWAANGIMTPADAAAYHRERLQTRPEGFGADLLKRLQRGASFSSTEYALARHTQSRLRRQFEKFFDGFDLLLTPTTPIPAPVAEGLNSVETAPVLTRFVAPFNLTGLPALSLPCGFTESGLPIGLQIVSHPWAEARVLRAGYAFEQATEWRRRTPPL